MKFARLLAALGGSICVCLLASASGESGTRLLTNRELNTLRGGNNPCPYGEIGEDLAECIHNYPQGPNNLCESIGCTGGGMQGGCAGSGWRVSQNLIADYQYQGTSCVSELHTGTSLPCRCTITCGSGALQPAKNCSLGSCKDPDPGAPVTGCRTCFIDSDPFECIDSMVSKAVPEYRECDGCPE